MNELKNLMDAREILARAYLNTVGLGMIHERVWHAIEHLERQGKIIIDRILSEETA